MDEPVKSGERTLILRKQGTHNKKLTYFVHVEAE